MGHALTRPLLLVFVFGSVGSVVELLLLEHVESATQLLPVGLLVIGAAFGGWLLLRPSPGARTAWLSLMAAYAVSGAVGVVLHLRGNLAFEQELDATARGFALWKETLMGATPAFAPGAMALLAAIGWLSLRAPGSGTRV